MFEASRLIFIYADSPLHAGTSRGLGAVDLPIQRETATGYPMIQASGLKGALRAAHKGKLIDSELHTIFGPETQEASEFAGALSVGQARLLLFPVRSLSGVFAWTTSRDVLARFMKDVALANIEHTLSLPDEPAESEALVAEESSLQANGSIVLEDFSFTSETRPEVATIGNWLVQHALPTGAEYKYWREQLPKKLCILHENFFRDFTQFSTEVQHHNRLNPDTKTVDSVGPWTSESLPADSLLYAPLLASPSRNKNLRLSGDEVLAKFAEAIPTRIQLGGNESTGQGFVALRLSGELK